MAFSVKDKAAQLLKRIGPDPTHPRQSVLVRAAVELALKEAYDQGMADARSPVPAAPAAKAKAVARSAVPEAEPECAHEWEDTFLDGRSIGSRCSLCGLSQRELQSRCDHFFVRQGKEEVCVACRKPKRKA